MPEEPARFRHDLRVPASQVRGTVPQTWLADRPSFKARPVEREVGVGLADPQRNDVEDVPVLRLADGCLAIRLLLVEPFELESAEERLGGVPRQKRHVLLAGPLVPFAEQLAAETSARTDRGANASPEVVEAVGVAERKREPGVEKFGARPVRVLEARNFGLQGA